MVQVTPHLGKCDKTDRRQRSRPRSIARAAPGQTPCRC